MAIVSLGGNNGNIVILLKNIGNRNCLGVQNISFERFLSLLITRLWTDSMVHSQNYGVLLTQVKWYQFKDIIKLIYEGLWELNK